MAWLRLCVNVLNRVKFSHFIARQLDSYLLHLKQRNCQSQSLIIVRGNSGDLQIDLQKVKYRLFRCVKYFALLLYKLTDLHLRNYISHSTQYAAVSQPDMNELAATKFPVRFVNELQTDDCTTAGRISERIVRWCSSVIIHQQYIYCLLVKDKRWQNSIWNMPWSPEADKRWALLFLQASRSKVGRSRPHANRFSQWQRPITHCTSCWADLKTSMDDCWKCRPYLFAIPRWTNSYVLLIPNEHFWQGFSSPYFALVYVSNDKRTVSISGFFFLSEGAFDTEVIRHRQSLAQAVCLQFSTTSIVWELLALWNSLRSATLTVDMGPFYSLFRDDTRKQYDLSFPSYFLTAPIFVLITLFHIHLFSFHWLIFHAPFPVRIL